LLSIFESTHTKKKEKEKIQNNCRKKKNIEENTRALRKWLKIGWGGSKIQILKFDSIFSTNENFVGRENLI